MSLNKCMIIGNLGRDPEMRYTPSGQAVTQFSVATNRNFKDQQGEWQSEAEWFRVVVWGDQGERAAEYLRKGSQCYIEGRLQTREWEKDGVKRYTTEIVVDMNGTMQLLGGRGNSEPADPDQAGRQPPRRNAGAQPQRQAPAQQPAPDYDSFDDDIPFADPYRGARSLLI